MEREACTRFVPVDQTRIRLETVESPRGGGAHGETPKDRGHRGPGTLSQRIDRIVAIAGSVGHPAGATAIGDCHRHPMTARGHHVADRRRGEHVLQRLHQLSSLGLGKAAQECGAVGQWDNWLGGQEARQGTLRFWLSAHFIVASGGTPSSLVDSANHWITSLWSGIPWTRRCWTSSASDSPG